MFCRTYANIITTGQDVGNCFTLFHHSTIGVQYNLPVKAGLSQSPVLKGYGKQNLQIEISEKPFLPNEVVRIKVNFRPAEYTTLNEPVFGSMIIHDSNEAPGIRGKSFSILPGHFYSFFIVKQTTELLPSPYATDCVDYIELNKDHYTKAFDAKVEWNPLYEYPLSKADCIIGCMSKNTLRKCNCWPPEVPYIYGHVSALKKDQIKWCDWDTETGLNITSKNNETISWFNYCFTTHEEFCQSKCKPECK